MLYVKCSDQIISNKFGYHWLYKGHFLSKNWRFIDGKYKSNSVFCSNHEKIDGVELFTFKAQLHLTFLMIF